MLSSATLRDCFRNSSAEKLVYTAPTMTDTNQAQETELAPSRNRFNRMEWAGAFGDLGTLIPFVVAYIGVLKMDPMGILFAFGLAMIVSGFYSRVISSSANGGRRGVAIPKRRKQPSSQPLRFMPPHLLRASFGSFSV